MFRAVVIIFLAIALSGCDAVGALKDGMQHARAVEGDLERSTGVRPQVGFNWRNGRLASVTVMFPGLYQTKPLGDLAGLVRDGYQGIQADAGCDRAFLCAGKRPLGLRAMQAWLSRRAGPRRNRPEMQGVCASALACTGG